MYLLFMDCIFKIVCPKMHEIDSKNMITLPSSPFSDRIKDPHFLDVCHLLHVKPSDILFLFFLHSQ